MRTLTILLLFVIGTVTAHAQITDTILKSGWYLLNNSNGIKRQLDKADDIYNLDKLAVSIEQFKRVELTTNNAGSSTLVIWLTAEGEKQWEKVTHGKSTKKFGLVVNNKLVHVVSIKGPQPGALTAAYNKSQQYLQYIMNTLIAENPLIKYPSSE